MDAGERLEKIIIAGGGPAGSSLAIRLATRGFDVTLVERERFPRHKVCGEFISPECLAYFDELGVREQMLASGGTLITTTVFFEAGGRGIEVPSTWLGAGGSALSLSRAEMDHRLLQRARTVGVKVREETSVIGSNQEAGRIASINVRCGTAASEPLEADIFVDATGRARVLSRLTEKRSERDKKGARKGEKLVGFKVHLRNANIEPGCCEIYSFPGGYGGLSRIENGLANHCFLVESEIVREMKGDADRIVEEIVYKNKRAFAALRGTKKVADWLAVSVDGFGVKTLNPAAKVLTVGDSAAFIDPFTGSGMLMALESSELLAALVSRHSHDPERLAAEYRLAFRQRFTARLRVCALLRRAALAPGAAKAIISLLRTSSAARHLVARSTRRAASPDIG